MSRVERELTLLQPQSRWSSDPGADMEFSGHDVQACGPMLSLYVPAAHSTHSPPVSV